MIFLRNGISRGDTNCLFGVGGYGGGRVDAVMNQRGIFLGMSIQVVGISRLRKQEYRLIKSNISRDVNLYCIKVKSLIPHIIGGTSKKDTNK